MAYVRRETGYWKHTTKPFDGYSCSICHTKFPASIFQTDAFNEFGSSMETFNFCPQCGSKLIEIR